MSDIAAIRITKKKNIITHIVNTVAMLPITSPAMPSPLFTGFFRLIMPVIIAGTPANAPRPVSDTIPRIKAAIARPFSLVCVCGCVG